MMRVLILACLAGGLTLATHAQQRPPVFRGGVAKARIDALVTHQGKPVPGLTAADFELRDNGVIQQVELATTADSVAVAILLDLSGSVQDEGLRDLRYATEELVAALRDDDRAWFVTFAQSFALKIGPTSDREAVRRALATIRPGGWTSMWDATFAGVSLVTGRAGRSLVIVLSDGIDTTSWLDEDRTVDTLKRAEVVVTAVKPFDAAPFGNMALERAAKATGGEVMFARRGDKMAQQFVELLEEFRLGYVLTYTPTASTRGDGWHKVDIRLKGKKGSVRAREGYYEAKR
jgi:Ca-activated chloride channel family protein